MAILSCDSITFTVRYYVRHEVLLLVLLQLQVLQKVTPCRLVYSSDVPKDRNVFILGVECQKESSDFFLDFLTRNINAL